MIFFGRAGRVDMHFQIKSYRLEKMAFIVIICLRTHFYPSRLNESEKYWRYSDDTRRCPEYFYYGLGDTHKNILCMNNVIASSHKTPSTKAKYTPSSSKSKASSQCCAQINLNIARSVMVAPDSQPHFLSQCKFHRFDAGARIATILLSFNISSKNDIIARFRFHFHTLCLSGEMRCGTGMPTTLRHFGMPAVSISTQQASAYLQRRFIVHRPRDIADIIYRLGDVIFEANAGLSEELQSIATSHQEHFIKYLRHMHFPQSKPCLIFQYHVFP